jgi:hypothetical protein
MKLKFLFSFLMAGFILLFSAQAEAQKSNILIEKGLAYLASVQSTSKGYEPSMGPSIDPTAVYPESKAAGQWERPGTSALCLQAFLNDGHNIDDPLYGTVVTNAINYILSQQTTTGYYAGGFGNTGENGYETAQCIFALKLALITPLNGGGFISGALATSINTALDLGLNYYTQDVQDAWTAVSWRYNRGYTSQFGGDMSVNQWVYLAFDIMNYTGKDIWNKIYNYQNSSSCSVGDYSYIGYTDCNTWTHGNTCSGTWGAVLAADKGVAAANNLKTRYYNYLDNYTLSQLIDPGQVNSDYVYSGGGYYYYLYGFSKAMQLSAQTIFAGGNWYEYLYNAIEGQHFTDGNGNYYWDQWGSQGPVLETALALLCLQTSGVPEGSTLKISLDTDPDTDDCFTFTVFDEQGNSAGRNNGVWFSNIPLSEWTSTSGDYFEITIQVLESGNYSVQIVNTCNVLKSAELCYRTYLLDELTDEECFLLEDVPPFTPIGATGFVNAIGGLNVIIVVPPTPLPNIQIDPSIVGFNPFEFSHTYNFQFDINELDGLSPITGINIFASDVTDQNGNVIPASAFTITPTNIPLILAGGTATVDVTLVTPASLPNPIGLFGAVITIQTPDQVRSVTVKIGAPSMSINPVSATVPFTAGSGNFALDFTGASGADWTITSDAAWLTATPDMGDNDATITFSYDANNSAVGRIGTLTISSPLAANTVLTFIVTQSGTGSQADQAIELPIGWLGISSYIIPTDPDIEVVLSGIEDQMEIILAKNGIYWPGHNINLIGNWNTYEGYKIKIIEPALLEIFGFPASSQVTIPAGMSFMPVLSSVPVSNQIFADMGAALNYAFDIQHSLMYWPAGGIYNISPLNPGMGYLVNLKAPVTVDFAPKYAAEPQQIIKPVNMSLWKDPVNTGNPHMISVSAEALSVLEPGDYIGVFNQAGNIAGLANYTQPGGNLLLVAYGDDFTTAIKEGLSEGEAMTFSVYRAATDQVYSIDVTFDASLNQGIYENGATSVIKALKLGALGIGNATKTGFNIYPNPTTGMLNVAADGNYSITLLNAAGQIVKEVTMQNAVTIDLSQLEKGIYFMKAADGNNLVFRKIVVE